MKWCEIFRCGRHTDASGNTKEWTQADLDAIMINFKEKNPDVPVCCGHTKTNSPAYGWVDELKAEGGRLFASFKQVVPEFVKAVNDGLFKTRSISLAPDLTLRHIAFLGAQPPAIKGMEQFCFADRDGDTVIQFSEINNESSNPEIVGEYKGADDTAPVDKKKGQKMKDGSDKEAQIVQFEEETAQKNARIQELEALLAQNQKEIKAKEFKEFCSGAVEAGNILPSQVPAVLDLLWAADGTSINFSDGGDGKKAASDTFKDFIKSLKQIDFSEISKKENVKEPEMLDFSDPKAVKNKILEIQKEYEARGVELNGAQALDIAKKGKHK